MKDKKLYICSREWTVSFPEHIVTDGETDFGKTYSESSRIEVATKKTTSQIRRTTLLHESLHAIFYTVSNGYPKEEEDGVQALEVGLYDMIRNSKNRWFWEIIEDTDG